MLLYSLRLSDANSADKYCMRLSEIKPIKPKTPEQQRVAALQATAKRAQAAVKAERARQQAAKAQQSAVAAQQISALGR